MSKSIYNIFIFSISFLTCLFISSIEISAEENQPHYVKNAMVIGDSMAGWLGERLNAYGQENGFNVGTIVWDGATIQKYANSTGLKKIIETQNPEIVFVCLGMNNLGEATPSNLKTYIDKIKSIVGNRRLIWIGPPSWPGKPQWTKLNSWLEEEFGSENYFNSFNLDLPRQSKVNPHPTRDGIMKWGDSIMTWAGNENVGFKSVHQPKSTQMARGKFFLYKRMRENL